VKGFYIRWGIILLAAGVIAYLGMERYDREVAYWSPDRLLQEVPSKPARVLGTIQGGSLVKDEGAKEAGFRLQGERETISVRYRGEDLDTLRELKILVVTGRWNPQTLEFEAEMLSLVPNYGFVAAAYLIGMLSTLLFLYHMERKLRLLYNRVRESKLYEPEAMTFDEG
jgi:cytochrome c-type biogenesis protein CcmE